MGLVPYWIGSLPTKGKLQTKNLQPWFPSSSVLKTFLSRCFSWRLYNLTVLADIFSGFSVLERSRSSSNWTRPIKPINWTWDKYSSTRVVERFPARLIMPRSINWFCSKERWLATAHEKIESLKFLCICKKFSLCVVSCTFFSYVCWPSTKHIKGECLSPHKL